MIQRAPLVYAAAAAIVILLGLLSRRYAALLPDFIASYAGDTLWALLIFILIGFCFPRRPTWQIAVSALLFSFAIEISQLYHAPWIDTLRSTTPGGLILGFGFLWSDLACYTAGVGIGGLIEILLHRRSSPRDVASSLHPDH